MNPDIKKITNKLAFFQDHTLRPEQVEALEFITKSRKRFIAIEAPTGVGKSAIGVIAGLMHPKSIYTVHSKSLQEQIQAEYPEVSILMGRGNYACGHDPDKMGDECNPSEAMPCTPMFCDYAVKKDKCKNANIKCFNYPYLFTEFNFAGAQFGGHDVVICDEADTIEEGLSRFIGLTITAKVLNEFGLIMPKYKAADGEHKVIEWKEWADKCLVLVKKKLKVVEGTANECSDENDGWIPDGINKELKRIKKIVSGFYIFKNNVNENWLYEEVNHFKYGVSHKFYPLWLTESLAEKFLWQFGKKWIFMSATLPEPNVLCRELGIPASELDYIKIGSPFPAKSCPIIFTESWDGTRKVFDIENAVEVVNKILDHHPEQKGIIHCVSYKIVKEIMEGCQKKFSKALLRDIRLNGMQDRLVTHNSSNRNAVLSNFLESTYPLVLVSPSMDRGVSLPDDKCRFSILAKTLFESLGDKRVIKRLYDYRMNGQGWYKNVTAQNIEQAVGRAMRNMDDWVVNYVIDSTTKKFVFDNPGLFNEYFKMCIKYEVPEWLK